MLLRNLSRGVSRAPEESESQLLMAHNKSKCNYYFVILCVGRHTSQCTCWQMFDNDFFVHYNNLGVLEIRPILLSGSSLCLVWHGLLFATVKGGIPVHHDA